MKKSVFLICLICFCCIGANCKKSNIVLSKFTKDIVDLMIDEYKNTMYNTGNYIVIILYEHEKGSQYARYLMEIDIDVQNDDLYLYGGLDMKYWGEIQYRDRKILIFGKQKNPFISIYGECKDFKQTFNIVFDEWMYLVEYDPLSWYIALDDELKLDTTKTEKIIWNGDISNIISVAQKYHMFNLNTTNH